MEWPQTALVLERWRKRAGVSRQRLADLADVSATYVRTIEAGVDDDGRVVVPSAGVIRRLAHGLALANGGTAPAEELERQAYTELMQAAGYLAPSVTDGTLHEPGTAYPAPAPALTQPGLAVTLPDAMLANHLQPVLAAWDTVSADDRALLFGILDFIAARCRETVRDDEEVHHA